ncbi:MAG: glucosamine--fructose-6-phosphate aminotransferase [Sedimenticola sp.]
MTKLINTLRDWQSESFNQTLKDELTSLKSGTLPLHLATTQGGIVDDSDVAVTVLGAADEGRSIRARVGVFFSEVIGGCSCGDDPLTASANCEMEIRIDKTSGEAEFNIIDG